MADLMQRLESVRNRLIDRGDYDINGSDVVDATTIGEAMGELERMQPCARCRGGEVMKIKAQRSLETTANEPRALFYNADRSWMWEGPVPGKWRPLFDEHGPRFFAGVEWNDPNKAPKFKTLMPEQGW